MPGVNAGDATSIQYQPQTGRVSELCTGAARIGPVTAVKWD